MSCSSALLKINIILNDSKERPRDMAKKRCSIVWDGLKAGPRYKGKDKAELDKMTAEFLKKHGSMTDSEEFG